MSDVGAEALAAEPAGRPGPDPSSLAVAAWSGLVVGEPLAGGARSRVHRAERGGELLVLRVSARPADSLDWELDLLDHLARHGVGVAEVVPADDGRRRVDGVVVQRFVEGGPPRGDAQWQAVAAVLRRVHELTVGWPQRPGFASAADLLDAEVGGDVRLDLMTADDRAIVRRAWARVVGAAARAGGRSAAGTAGRTTRRTTPGTAPVGDLGGRHGDKCVVHGDVGAGNVLVGPAGVTLIDWDEARVDLPVFDEAALPGGTWPGSPGTADRWAVVAAGLAWEAATCWAVEPEYAARVLRELRAHEQAGPRSRPVGTAPGGAARVHNPGSSSSSTGATPVPTAQVDSRLASSHAHDESENQSENEHESRHGTDGSGEAEVSTAVQQSPGWRTLDDWIALPEDEQGRRTELLDGQLVVTPPPSTDHQDIERELLLALHSAIQAHRVSDRLAVYTGIGVGVGRHGLVPDLVVVRPPYRRELMVPVSRVALAVEIVSPHSRRRDRVSKPAAYAASGIPFYWRVEPEGDEGPTLVTHRLSSHEQPAEPRRYVEAETLLPGESRTVSASPVPLVLDPGSLLPHC